MAFRHHPQQKRRAATYSPFCSISETLRVAIAGEYMRARKQGAHAGAQTLPTVPTRQSLSKRGFGRLRCSESILKVSTRSSFSI